MPLVLGRSGNFHIVSWVGSASLQEAQKLSADVEQFRASHPRNIRVHGVCILTDATHPPAKDARDYMDRQVANLLTQIESMHYVLEISSGFRRATLQAIISGSFLMRGVGDRIDCHKTLHVFLENIGKKQILHATTPTLLEGEIRRVLRQTKTAAPPKLLSRTPSLLRGVCLKKSLDTYREIFVFDSLFIPHGIIRWSFRRTWFVDDGCE